MNSNVLNVHLLACVEDAIEKLQITGQIMPITYEMKRNAKMLVNESVNDIIDTQRELEAKFDNIISNRGDKDELTNVTKSLKAATHGLHRTYKQNPIASDNLEKIESDRLFLEMVLENLMAELDDGDFSTLQHSVRAEKASKDEFQAVIKREEQGRAKIRELQKAINDIKQEREIEVQQRNELIAHLKDRFQELRAKTNMEAQYVKKSTDNTVAQAKKKCEMSEHELKQQIEKLSEQIEDEKRCNAELESYIKGAIAKLKNLTEYWNEKSDRETIEKQVELDKIKALRAKDLEKYQSLLKTYNEYEAVAIEDRNEKDKARRIAEQEKFELEATIKIQGWWRGMMMRHKIGAYGKKKKGKKGKKGKKKK